MTPEQRIEAYQDAYFAANEKCIGVSYISGWYRVGWPPRKYRGSEIDAFTAELRRRVAQGMAPEGRGREGGPGSSELPSPVAESDAPKGASA